MTTERHAKLNVGTSDKADAEKKTLDEIRPVVTEASPVYDSVANPVAVETAVERVR